LSILKVTENSTSNSERTRAAREKLLSTQSEPGVKSSKDLEGENERNGSGSGGIGGMTGEKKNNFKLNFETNFVQMSS